MLFNYFTLFIYFL